MDRLIEAQLALMPAGEPGGLQFGAARLGLIKGSWMMAFDPWNVAANGLNPRANLACFVFNGLGNVTGTVTIKGNGTAASADFVGRYELRRNTQLHVIDGYMNVFIPDFAILNQFYLIRRSPDEIGAVLLSSNAYSDGTATPLANILEGIMRKVHTPWLDWLLPG